MASAAVHGRRSQRTRLCRLTGLALSESQGQHITRIQKVSYGPLNPWLRNSAPTSDERLSWGRYDVAGHRTIYGGAPVAAAYAECLGYLRIDAGLKVRLSDLFDDADDTGDPRTLLDLIESEWDSICHMPPSKLVRGWRDARNEYVLSLPVSGWFVNVEHPRSIAAIRRALWNQLGDIGVTQLSTGVLRSERREVTTMIAGWIRQQVLDDGSLPHGIKYGSKHGEGWDCWAVWLRAVDDGKPVASEPTKLVSQKDIDLPENNRPLKEISDLFGFKVF